MRSSCSARLFSVRPCVRVELFRRGTRRLFDEPRNGVGVRDETYMARADLDGLRTHALRVESLEIRIDGLVLLRDQVERRNGLPRRVCDCCPEDSSDNWFLCCRHDARVGGRDIAGEELAELCAV